MMEQQRSVPAQPVNEERAQLFPEKRPVQDIHENNVPGQNIFPGPYLNLANLMSQCLLDELGKESAGKRYDQPIAGYFVPGTMRAVELLLKSDKFSGVDSGIWLDLQKLHFVKEYLKGSTYKRIIGKGTFGVACRIVGKASKTEVVRKKVKAENINPLEVLIPAYCRHPAIVQVYGCARRKDNTFDIHMENAGLSFDRVMENKTLRQHLTEQVIMDIGRQGYDALQFLGRHGVMHLDIKPQNLCLEWNYQDATFDLKLCDFGSARHMGDSIVRRGWTPAYMAPGQCRFVLSCSSEFAGFWTDDKREITPQVDVYSFALCLLYLLRRRHCVPMLCPNSGNRGLILQTANDPEKVKICVKKSWDPSLQSVLNRSLCEHPRERIQPDEACKILSTYHPAVITPHTPTGAHTLTAGTENFNGEPMEIDQPQDPPDQHPGNMPQLDMLAHGNIPSPFAEDKETEEWNEEPMEEDQPQGPAPFAPPGQHLGYRPNLGTLAPDKYV